MTFDNVDNLYKVTRHERLAWQLSRKIRSGAWPAGAKLPSIRQLAQEYQTAPATVGKTVRLLEQAGLIICRPNSGIYVNSLEELCRARDLHGFSVSDDGKADGNDGEMNKVLHFIFHLESLKNFTGSFYPEVLCLMREEAERIGWRLRIGDSAKLEEIFNCDMEAARTAGVVYMPDYAYPFDLEWPELPVPRVMMSLGEKSFDANYVTPDNYRGGYHAAYHLSQRAVNIIGLSGSLEGEDIFRYKLYFQRFDGMCDYCRQHALPLPEHLNPADAEHFAARLRQLLQLPRGERPALVLLGDIWHEEIRERFFELSGGMKLTAEFELAIFQDFDTASLPGCHRIQFSRRLFCREVLLLIQRIGEYPEGQPLSVKIPMTFGYGDSI